MASAAVPVLAKTSTESARSAKGANANVVASARRPALAVIEQRYFVFMRIAYWVLDRQTILAGYPNSVEG